MCNTSDILLCQNMLKHYYKDDILNILNIINYRCLHISIYIPTLKYFIDFTLTSSIRVYIILQQLTMHIVNAIIDYVE